MENLDIQNPMWQLQALFHKSWAEKVKNRTGATSVIHIKDELRDGEKVNCIRVRKGEKELMYGGQKDFSLFTPQDYETLIEEFNRL